MWYDDRTHLVRSIKDSEEDRDRLLDALEHREKTALGALRKDDEGVIEDNPDNLAFSVYSVIAPAAVTRPPRLRAKSNRGHLEQLYVTGAAAATTHIAKKQRMERQLGVMFWDYFFKPFCVGFVEMGSARMSDMTAAEREDAIGRLHASQDEEVDVGGEPDDEPTPRATDTPLSQVPPRWARFKRIDPRMAGYDTSGSTVDEARYTWHETLEDFEVLKSRAEEHPDDWNLDQVEAMTRCNRDGAYHQSELGKYVRYYVVYVPGATLDDEDPEPNDHGVIFTLGAKYGKRDGEVIDALEVRRPYYWNGHPDGPHIIGGQYATGTDSHWTTLLGANEDAIAMLESVTASVHQRIRDHKTVHAFDQTIEQEAAELIDAKNGAYVGVPGLRDGMVQSFETSAVSPAEIAELREVQANVARGVGIDDGGRGSANGDATATAVTRAANTTDRKVGMVLDRWSAIVGDVMDRMMFATCHDDRVFVRLDEEARVQLLKAQLAPAAAQAGMMPEYVDAIVEQERANETGFYGGDFADQANGYDWSGVETYIEPHSMDAGFGERAVMREAAWNEQLAMIGTLAAQQPHIRWQQRLRATGEAFGIPDADQLLDPAIAAQVAQIALAANQPEPSMESLGGEGPSEYRTVNGGAARTNGEAGGAFGQTA